MTADESRPNNTPPPARHWGQPFGWIAAFLLLGFILTVFLAAYGITGPGLFGVETSVTVLAVGAVVLGLLFLVTLVAMRGSMRKTAKRINLLEDRLAQLDRGVAIRAGRLESQITGVQTNVRDQIAMVQEEKTPVVATTQVVVNERPPVAPFRALSRPVTAVDGVGPAFSGRLADVGIDTTQDLRYADPAVVAAELNVPEDNVGEWVAQADLLRLPAMTSHLAHLMAESGTRNVSTLSRLNVDEVRRRIGRLDTKATIDDALVEECIREARQLRAYAVRRGRARSAASASIATTPPAPASTNGNAPRVTTGTKAEQIR